MAQSWGEEGHLPLHACEQHPLRNEVARTGNPTRSPQVARLIANMKRFQFRCQGLDSQVCHALLIIIEFERIMIFVGNLPNLALSLFVSVAMCIQFAHHRVRR